MVCTKPFVEKFPPNITIHVKADGKVFPIINNRKDRDGKSRRSLAICKI